MTIIEQIDKTTPADEAMAILERDGVVIYKNLVEDDVMDRIQHELDSFIDRSYNGEGEFWGYKTKRFGALVAKSRTFALECAPNPQILAVMDRLLGPRCENGQYQLHVTMLVNIGPNETPQIMHRDDGLLPFKQPGPQILCNTMWALTDFTEENGATNVIIGSHKWPDGRSPKPSDEVVQAVMPKGSCLIYVGSVWHGGGENRTNTYRTGMISGYSVGWVRQEENMYLAVPPDIAKDLPENVQHLIGYKIYGGFLGWVEGQDPHVVLEERYSDVMPAVPEGGEATEDTSIFRTAKLEDPILVKLSD